jgi:hypothetical protein
MLNSQSGKRKVFGSRMEFRVYSGRIESSLGRRYA